MPHKGGSKINHSLVSALVVLVKKRESQTMKFTCMRFQLSEIKSRALLEKKMKIGEHFSKNVKP